VWRDEGTFWTEQTESAFGRPGAFFLAILLKQEHGDVAPEGFATSAYGYELLGRVKADRGCFAMLGTALDSRLTPKATEKNIRLQSFESRLDKHCA
jgi:hypothetical protein